MELTSPSFHDIFFLTGRSETAPPESLETVASVVNVNTATHGNMETAEEEEEVEEEEEEDEEEEEEAAFHPLTNAAISSNWPGGNSLVNSYKFILVETREEGEHVSQH